MRFSVYKSLTLFFFVCVVMMIIAEERALLSVRLLLYSL